MSFWYRYIHNNNTNSFLVGKYCESLANARRMLSPQTSYSDLAVGSAVKRKCSWDSVTWLPVLFTVTRGKPFCKVHVFIISTTLYDFSFAKKKRQKQEINRGSLSSSSFAHMHGHPRAFNHVKTCLILWLNSASRAKANSEVHETLTSSIYRLSASVWINKYYQKEAETC